MKITVKHNDTEIVYDESDNGTNGKSASSFPDGLKRILEIIESLTEQVLKMNAK